MLLTKHTFYAIISFGNKFAYANSVLALANLHVKGI